MCGADAVYEKASFLQRVVVAECTLLCTSDSVLLCHSNKHVSAQCHVRVLRYGHIFLAAEVRSMARDNFHCRDVVPEVLRALHGKSPQNKNLIKC